MRSCLHQLVLGQAAVDKKSSEITAIPELLTMQGIESSIFIFDAMGCQSEIAKNYLSKRVIFSAFRLVPWANRVQFLVTRMPEKRIYRKIMLVSISNVHAKVLPPNNQSKICSTKQNPYYLNYCAAVCCSFYYTIDF